MKVFSFECPEIGERFCGKMSVSFFPWSSE